MDWSEAKGTKENRGKYAKELFESFIGSSIFGTYFDQCMEAHDLYEGNQWNDEEMVELNKQHLVPYVSNQIAPRIDNVTGAEITTRTRVSVLARSSDTALKTTANAMTDLILFLQEKNFSSSKWSDVMKIARISGVGWHEIIPRNDTIEEECVENPCDVVWDPADRTLDFSESRGRARIRWKTRGILKTLYPKFEDEIESASDAGCNWFRAPIGDWGQRMTFGRNGYYDSTEDMLMVVHMQYRVPKTFYSVLTKEGYLLHTFSEKEAKKRKARGETPSENEGFQVRSCIFIGDLVLDESEYPYQLDYYRGKFTTTPVVLKREANTGIPYGLVRGAKDDQKLFNKKQAKINWYLGARQIVADVDAVEDPKILAEEAARPDGIMFKKKGAELAIQKNLDEVQAHTSMLPMHSAAIERNMGIYDESLGADTNSISGVAIQRKQNGTSKTQAPALDRLRIAKFEYAAKLITMAQQKFDERMVFNVTDEDTGEQRQVQINAPSKDATGKEVKDPDGNVVRDADIRLLDFQVFLNEAPDLATQSQEGEQKITNFLAGGGQVQALTPGVLELWRIPKSNPIYQEVLQANQAAQAAQAQEIAGGQVPPEMPSGGPTAQ